MLSAEQVRQIRAALTWGDQSHGRKEGGADQQDVMAHAMYRAAKRLGLANGSIDEFLDSVEVEVLTEALTEPRDPTSGDTPTSPPSVTSGA